ncbi:MAG TPA: RidA family protein [Chloroflexota bacterium]|nr:RidA family protein [Chloroflexota bacterium]
MKKEIVAIPGVKPVKYLSRAVKFGNLVFVAGTTGRNLLTGEMPEDAAGQTRVLLDNMKMVLESAGASMDSILKMTCYLANLADKPAFDEVYTSTFTADPPARACFAVADLGAGVKVEIEAIAGIPQ